MHFLVVNQLTKWYSAQKNSSAYFNTQASQLFGADVMEMTSASADVEWQKDDEINTFASDDCGELVVELISGCAISDGNKMICKDCVRYSIAEGDMKQERAICKECAHDEQK